MAQATDENVSKRQRPDGQVPDRVGGRTVAGRYLIESVLGHGGMGEVFVARQAPLQRRVALKLIRTEYAKDPRLAARFEREARALAHLSDPHVVTLLDFGVTDDGELYMAMELLEGETLRARMSRQGALPTKSALDIAQQICRGLAAAHKAGVVHRDLKPENIMLMRVSAAGGSSDFVKVLDLGVARVPTGGEHQTLTEQGKLVGTPGYMAPEMLLYGVLEDPRSDLYALGVMLFEMLTGEAPFSAPTPIALVMKHAHEAPRHLDLVLPEVDQLVQLLLRKEPGERPANAAAVLQRIAELLALPGGSLGDAVSLSAIAAARPSGETPRAVPQRNVDVNAATTPKLQTPLTAAPPPALAAPAATQLAVPPAAAPATTASPARTRATLGLAAAIVLAVALGGAVIVALTQRAAIEPNAPASMPTPPPPTQAPVTTAPATQPTAAEPTAAEPTAAEPTATPPPVSRPPRIKRPVTTTTKPNEPAPGHVPDLTP